MDKISLVNNRPNTFAVGIKQQQINQPNILNPLKIEEHKEEFTKTKKIDASNDGKFSFKEAAKNFIKGLVSPVTTIIKHPFVSLAAVATVGLACSALPILCPIMTLAFGAFSVYHLGKSTVNTVKNYKAGNYDKAEKGFTGVGEGVIYTALSAFGFKHALKIAKKAKLLVALGKKSMLAAKKAKFAVITGKKSILAAKKAKFLTASGKKSVLSTTKTKITKMLSNKGFWKALYKTLTRMSTPKSLTTTIARQLTLCSIRENFINSFLSKKTVFKKSLNLEEQIKIFKQTSEGIRRDKLSKEQLASEIKRKYEQVFDRLNIPKKLRPKIKIVNSKVTEGGSYNKYKHTVELNANAYQAGVFDLDETIINEAVRAREALLRTAISEEKAYKLASEQLSSKIIPVENGKIIVKDSPLGVKLIDAPKIPPKLGRNSTNNKTNILHKNESES